MIFRVFLCLFLCALPAYAERAGDFAALKKEFLHLRNTDSHIVQEDAWRRVARDLESHGDANKKTDAPTAYFNAAIMYRTLYEEKGKKADLKDAQRLFGTVASDFKTAPAAPGALKELADLSRKYDDDEDEARKYLKKIVIQYPKSDLYDYAYSALYEKDSLKVSSGNNQKAATGGTHTIVLDPGHGGEDFGAVGVSGLLEKDVVLDIAFLLEEKLTKELGATVLLTRRKDVFVPLQRRMELANEKNADIFVSLHANASENGTARGFEVYVLDNANDAASQLLSERENASGGSVDDISFMLADLIQSSKMPESVSLAKSIEQSVGKRLPEKWPQAKILKVKKAPFYVLVGAHMPAVLAELFFINEATDGAYLADSAFRRDLADAIYHGIKGFLEK